MDSPRLELRNITKIFPGVKALTDLNFSLRKGEIHSLCGENGAGKSTLINCMIGLYQPDGGEIYLDGEKTTMSSPNDALLKGIAIVPQELNLIPDLTVAENIFLGVKKTKKGLIHSIDWAGIYRESEDALKRLGIHIDINQKVGTMSVANQQLVQIARAMAFGADILILDEPTACLTLNEADRLLKMLENFRDEGKAIVYVSHHLEEVTRISDRVTIMRDGRFIEVIERQDFSIPKIIKGMVGRDVTYPRIEHEVDENAEIAIKVEGLTRKNEFRNISFEIKKGEIFGIAGLVGAGRTELVSSIFGERKLDSGDIYVFGKKTEISSPVEAIGLGFGYLPEERRRFGILPVLSLRENMTIADMKKIYKFPMINRAAEREIVDEYIKKINIKCSDMEQQIRKLSGGNQQKVILARWLAVGAKFLILDEPTRGVDVNAKAEIHQLIKQMADAGMTVIVVSSEMEELLSLANRIMIMNEGEQKDIADASQLTPEGILKIALTK